MNKINNPYLKKLISEISSKTSEGRITEISWGLIDEAKKKKNLKKEADEKKKPAPTEEPAADGSELPSVGKDEPPSKETSATDSKADKKAPAPTQKKDAAPSPEKPDLSTPDESAEEESEKAKDDAAKAKAELEKAKAEKAAAEKEIEQNKYVKLASDSGAKYLLGKVVDHAFKSGEIDALAGEMIEKLKIRTPEDMAAFSEDTVTYMSIPGMPELISSMKSMATQQPDE